MVKTKEFDIEKNKELDCEPKVLKAIYTACGFNLDMVLSFKKRKQEQEQQEQQEWYSEFVRGKYSALYHLGFLTKQQWMTPSISYLHHIADCMIRKISSAPELEIVRGDINVQLTQEELAELKDAVPYTTGMEFVNADWILNVWSMLMEEFRKEIKEYDGTTSGYFAERNSNISVAGRVFFHLVENKDENYPFAFMATYSTKPNKSKKAVHTPLKNALIEFKKDQEKLLSLMSSVAKAADQSEFISELMENGELFAPIKFKVQEAYTFMKEIPIYEAAGIMCRVPDWWRKRTNSIKLSITVGEKNVSKVGQEAILDFKPTLMIDDESITKDQLREFLNMAEGLVQYKGKWTEINKTKLEVALQAFDKAKTMIDGGGISLAEAMRMELNPEKEFYEEKDLEIAVVSGPWLKKVRDMLTNPEKIQPLAQEPTFHADLRKYQEEGYRWLDTMAQLGFGACLADDMGLGKTVQMIAWLEHYRIQQGGHALLVLPASLIGNWQREIEKFAPELTYQVLHKSASKSDAEIELDDSKFLCITTYGMVSRLVEIMNKKWDILILDEAQAIKNPGTKQSKAVKAIPSGIRIAMTGTPIENSLGDLWSLFDFLNRGILGTAKEFDGFIKQIDKEETGYADLKRIVNPFILRRLKTDWSIISDLPDKIEIQEYTALSKKQTVLYQKLVDNITVKLATASGIERKGLVLASIMKFKQICNHPDQYLGLEEYKKENSGKFEQLEQICDTIYEKRERVLVFTQFREMTEPLSEFLEGIFHRKGFVLHGGTTIKKRDEMVKAFNGEEYIPYMVLSLKAGGVGLNLTAANHVIHFDRWWNPAVENQASDRAFRIGQKKNVVVHKFITQGTIEEKINAMIEEKQKLAGDILETSGEKWITEMDNEQLLNLFKLGGVK